MVEEGVILPINYFEPSQRNAMIMDSHPGVMTVNVSPSGIFLCAHKSTDYLKDKPAFTLEMNKATVKQLLDAIVNPNEDAAKLHSPTYEMTLPEYLIKLDEHTRDQVKNVLLGAGYPIETNQP